MTQKESFGEYEISGLSMKRDKSIAIDEKIIDMAKVDEAKALFAALKGDYKSVQDRKRLENKHKIRAVAFFVLALFFGFIAGYVQQWFSSSVLIGGLLYLVFLIVFIFEMGKMSKYSPSSDDEMLFNLCKAYEKIQAFRKPDLDVYLNDAIKAIDNVARIVTITSSSSWKTTREFTEQRRILGETIERKILSNLSKNTPKETMDVIILEIAKLAKITRNMTATTIKEYVENLRANKAIPEKEYVKLSGEIIQSLKSNYMAWEITKGILIFAFSLLVVVGLTWLLCEWQKANLGDYINVVIMGTITLFAAIRIKKKK